MRDVPRHVREEVQTELWRQADELAWEALPNTEKSQHYENWTNSSAIGGRLAAHLDPRTVRVYIKDTLLKAYARHKLQEHEAAVLRAIGRPSAVPKDRFIKPHGVIFADGEMVHWGRADDWKIIVTSAFERARLAAASSSAIVLFKAHPRFAGAMERSLVEDAAQKLGAAKPVWFD